MILLNGYFLSTQLLIYALNVAVASVIACGAGLFVVACCRKCTLPTRHGILFFAMVATLLSPWLVACAFLAGISVWRMDFHVGKYSVPRPQRTITLGHEWPGKTNVRVTAQASVPLAQPRVENDYPESDETNASSEVLAGGLPVLPVAEVAPWPSDSIRGVSSFPCAIWFGGTAASLVWIVRGLFAVRGLTRSLRDCLRIRF